MRKPKRASVRVRSEDHVGRLVLALVREEVSFDVRPERNGWWKVSADMLVESYSLQSDMNAIAKRELQAIEQRTRCP